MTGARSDQRASDQGAPPPGLPLSRGLACLWLVAAFAMYQCSYSIGHVSTRRDGIFRNVRFGLSLRHS